MGADKNSSRRRCRLQQDEHGFLHTSSTDYPNRPSPRSHWSATEPRNQLLASQTRERSGTPTSSPLTNTGRTGEQHRSDRSLLVKLGDFHRKAPHRSNRCNTPVRPVSARKPKTPNRPTELQTDPNSKQLQHRTTTNTPRRSPEQKHKRGCTGQTGERHRSDRCDLGFSGSTAPASQHLQIQALISQISPQA
jgi:hypothetical protein